MTLQNIENTIGVKADPMKMFENCEAQRAWCLMPEFKQVRNPSYDAFCKQHPDLTDASYIVNNFPGYSLERLQYSATAFQEPKLNSILLEIPELEETMKKIVQRLWHYKNVQFFMFYGEDPFTKQVRGYQCAQVLYYSESHKKVVYSRPQLYEEFLADVGLPQLYHTVVARVALYHQEAARKQKKRTASDSDVTSFYDKDLIAECLADGCFTAEDIVQDLKDGIQFTKQEAKKNGKPW